MIRVTICRRHNVPILFTNAPLRRHARVYGVTANAVVGLVMPPNFALILVVPVPMAVAKPLVLMVATPGLEEVHVTLLVTF